MTIFKFLYLISILCISFSINSQKDVQSISQIGTQIWMSKNLDVEKFKNGDKIYFAKSQKRLKTLEKKGKPAWCFYNFDSKNGEKYGKLYNWEAVIDPRGLAPEGWHIPTKDEWEKLSNFLGENGGEKLKAKSGWDKFIKENEFPNGTDEFSFNALPGGRQDLFGNFEGLGNTGYWWTCSQVDNDEFLNYYYIQSTDKDLRQNAYHRGMFLSVRCLENQR
jgi:uncharacterized protein (TIGR02145 family)